MFLVSSQSCAHCNCCSALRVALLTESLPAERIYRSSERRTARYRIVSYSHHWPWCGVAWPVKQRSKPRRLAIVRSNVRSSPSSGLIWPLNRVGSRLTWQFRVPQIGVDQKIVRFYRAALHAGRSSEEKAVCLCVRLSVCQTRALWQKGKKNLSRFLYHTKDYNLA